MPTFSQSIDAFCKKTKVKPALVLKKIAMDGLRGVMMKSPVDTGRFRANWRVGINVIDLTTTPPAKGQVAPVGNTDQGTLLSGTNKINAAKWGDTIWITNNLPYGTRLEQGWSKQAPSGVLKLTYEELKASILLAAKSVGAL